MSIERALLIIGFLVAIFGVLVSTWRSHKESRAKTSKRKPITQYPPYHAGVEREKARKIFKGPELQKALEAIAFLERERSDLLRDEAEFQEHDNQSERNAFQLVILMGFAIVLGIAYGLYKFANAP
jgi:hypothetical protein